jgi:hypothetical protein
MHKYKNELVDMSTGDTPTTAPPGKRRKGNDGAAMLEDMDKMFEPDLDDNEDSSVLDKEWALYRTKVTKTNIKACTVGGKFHVLKFYSDFVNDDCPAITASARAHFGALSTSTSSERTFSQAGLTLTKLRNQMSPSTLAMMMLLRKNKNLLASIADVKAAYKAKYKMNEPAPGEVSDSDSDSENDSDCGNSSSDDSDNE